MKYKTEIVITDRAPKIYFICVNKCFQVFAAPHRFSFIRHAGFYERYFDSFYQGYEL